MPVLKQSSRLAADRSSRCPGAGLPARRRSTRPIATATATWSPTCRPIRSRSSIRSTLIFAYTPVEDPAVYGKVWDGFIKHLEKTTGKRVVFFPVQSNAAQYEAMRSGRLHVAGVNAGGNPTRGELRRLRAVRHDGGEGRQLRLRDGNHRAGRQPDQDAGRPQGQEDRLHRADLELRLQGAVGDPRRPTSSSRPSGTSSRCSPASTTTRSSASSTRTTTRRRSPIRCSTRMIDRKVFDPGEDPLDLQVGDLPDHRLRPRLQPRSEAGREDQGGVLHLPVGGLGAQAASSRRRTSSSRSPTRRTGA